MTDTSSLQPVIDTALRSAPPVGLEPGKIWAFHTPTGIQKVDLTGDQYKTTPTRKTGTTTVRDVDSFLAYFNKHSDENTEVYADADRLTVAAVLDAHTDAGPRWGEHRLVLALRKTDSWRTWEHNDGQLLPQAEFAEFIEDNLPDILTPSAADMLEIAQSIQGATKAEFQSSTRLTNGQRQFQFVETTTAKAGQKGQLTVPEVFTIGVVPFDGSQGYKLTARFRYRLGRDGALSLGYKLERPGDILRTAFSDIVNALDGETTQPILNGSPAR